MYSLMDQEPVAVTVGATTLIVGETIVGKLVASTSGAVMAIALNTVIATDTSELATTTGFTT